MTKMIQPYHHYYDATRKEEGDQDFKLNNLHNYENEPNYFDIARYSSKLKKIPSDKKLRKNFVAHQKRMDSRVLSQKYTDWVIFVLILSPFEFLGAKFENGPWKAKISH